MIPGVDRIEDISRFSLFLVTPRMNGLADTLEPNAKDQTARSSGQRNELDVAAGCVVRSIRQFRRYSIPLIFTSGDPTTHPTYSCAKSPPILRTHMRSTPPQSPLDERAASSTARTAYREVWSALTVTALAAATAGAAVVA